MKFKFQVLVLHDISGKYYTFLHNIYLTALVTSLQTKIFTHKTYEELIKYLLKMNLPKSVYKYIY